VYENACPTIPEAAKDEVIDGIGQFAGLTVRIKVFESEPQEFVAVNTILYVPEMVGVPESMPVEVANDNPSGMVEVETKVEAGDDEAVRV
jgi:hypothetical protein